MKTMIETHLKFGFISLTVTLNLRSRSLNLSIFCTLLTVNLYKFGKTHLLVPEIASNIQSTLVISTSVISNNRLSRRKNLVLVITQKSKIRL